MFGQEVFGMGIVLGFRNQAKSGMDAARKDFDSLYYSASKADMETKARLESMSQNWRKAKRNFALSGAAMAGIGIMSSLNMETEQSTAYLRGLGVEGAESYINAAREVMAKGNLPIAYHQGLEELYNLKSGDLQNDVLISALKATGTAALATRGDISEAVSAFITDYNLSFDKMAGTMEQRSQQWSDVVSASVMKYYTKLPSLAHQHEKVAADAALMGYGLEQTYTAIGALMSGGVKEEAGSSLRAALKNISRAAEITGLEFVTAEGKAKPLLEIIDLLRNKYGPTLEISELDELQKAFDTEGKKAMATMIIKRDAYAEGIELAKRYGLSNKMAAENTDTLKFKIEGLKNALMNLGDTVGGSDSSSRGFVEGTTNLINKTDDVLKKHPGIVTGSFDYMKLVAGFGALSGFGFIKDIVKGGMVRALGPAAGSTAFGWLGPMSGGKLGFEWIQKLRDFADATGPSVETEGLNSRKQGLLNLDFWRGNWGATSDAPDGYEPFQMPKNPAKFLSAAAIDEPDVKYQMKAGKWFRSAQTGTNAQINNGSTASQKSSAPKQVTNTNSFNVTLQFPNATSPEQIRAEIEKFLKERNEEAKRWFGLRRGEDPTEYEN